MNIEESKIAMSSRTPWQAIDLGIKFTMARYPYYVGIWLASALPTFLLLLWIFWDFIPGLLIGFFILKPIFEIGVIYAMSIDAFVEPPTFWRAVGKSYSLMFKYGLRYIFFKRLSFFRATLLPAFMLEGAKWSFFSMRQFQILSYCRVQASWFIFFGMHVEILIAGMVLMFVNSFFSPLDLAPTSDVTSFVSALLEYFADELLLDMNSADFMRYSAITFLVGAALWIPIFAGGNFMLYFQSRIYNEAWDIKLALEKMTRRMEVFKAAMPEDGQTGGSGQSNTTSPPPPTDFDPNPGGGFSAGDGSSLGANQGGMARTGALKILLGAALAFTLLGLSPSIDSIGGGFAHANEPKTDTTADPAPAIQIDPRNMDEAECKKIEGCEEILKNTRRVFTNPQYFEKMGLDPKAMPIEFYERYKDVIDPKTEFSKLLAEYMRSRGAGQPVTDGALVDGKKDEGKLLTKLYDSILQPKDSFARSADPDSDKDFHGIISDAPLSKEWLPEAEDRKRWDEAYADGEFGHMGKAVFYEVKPRNALSEKEKFAEDKKKELDAIGEEKYMGFLEFFSYFILGAFAAALAIFAYRWMRTMGFWMESDGKKEKVSSIFGMDIDPDSLPDDLPGVAARTFESNQREAMQLVFRGLLSKLVNDYDLPLKKSMTENEIVSLVRIALPAKKDVTAGIVRQWILLAYAHKSISRETFMSILENYKRHFPNLPPRNFEGDDSKNAGSKPGKGGRRGR